MKKLGSFVALCIYTFHLTLTLHIHYYPKQYWLLFKIDTVFIVGYKMDF